MLRYHDTANWKALLRKAFTVGMIVEID